MFKLLLRTWHYSAALLTSLFNAHADPRIQIEQAIEEAKQQHLRLAGQTAAVIGNERELQLKIARGTKDLERLEASASQALHLAEAARSKGEAQRAAGFERTAQLFATQLASAETSLTDLRELHSHAAAAAGAAQHALEQNRFQLQRQLAERSKLLTDLEAARMQERMADALQAIDSLSPSRTTPTLPQVRERIDRRIANGAGRIAIAQDSDESRMVEVERAVIDAHGAELLEKIRRREGLAPAKEE